MGLLSVCKIILRIEMSYNMVCKSFRHPAKIKMKTTKIFEFFNLDHNDQNLGDYAKEVEVSASCE